MARGAVVSRITSGCPEKSAYKRPPMLCPAMVFCTSVGVTRSGLTHSPGSGLVHPYHPNPSPMAPFVFSSLRDPKAIVGSRQAK